MINTIYQMGDDAFDNQATISITPLAFMKQTEPLKMRIKSFTTPEYAIEYYDVPYKGYKISKPKPGNPNLERTLSIEFRVDKYYSIYRELLAWGKMVYDHDADDAGLGDNSATRTQIVVQADNGPTWTYTGCIFEKLSGFTYDQTGDGEPISCTLDVRFLDYTMV